MGSKGTALSPRQWTNSDSVETTFTSSLSAQETTWSLGRYSMKETITMLYPQGSPASETKVMRGSTSSTEQGMAMTLVWGWRSVLRKTKNRHFIVPWAPSRTRYFYRWNQYGSEAIPRHNQTNRLYKFCVWKHATGKFPAQPVPTLPEPNIMEYDIRKIAYSTI